MKPCSSWPRLSVSLLPFNSRRYSIDIRSFDELSSRQIFSCRHNAAIEDEHREGQSRLLSNCTQSVSRQQSLRLALLLVVCAAISDDLSAILFSFVVPSDRNRSSMPSLLFETRRGEKRFLQSIKTSNDDVDFVMTGQIYCYLVFLRLAVRCVE